MYTIYQGYAFPISIESDVELDISQSRLFNPLTKTMVVLESMFSFVEDGKYLYQVVLSAEQTRQMKLGMYNLEIRTPDAYMAKHVHGFATVSESAVVYL